MKEVFTREDLVGFGNYLLSENRKERILNELNLDQVTHSDIENFKDALNV